MSSKKERDRDAAPHAGPRRSARRVYQAIQKLVRQVIVMRWAEARAAERAGTVGAELKFRGKFEAPGFVAIRGVKQTVHLLFYMKEVTRDKWKQARAISAKGGNKAQEFAPPAQLPADALSIFTDGSAIYDKYVKAWVAAGKAANGMKLLTIVAGLTTLTTINKADFL